MLPAHPDGPSTIGATFLKNMPISARISQSAGIISEAEANQSFEFPIWYRTMNR